MDGVQQEAHGAPPGLSAAAGPTPGARLLLGTNIALQGRGMVLTMNKTVHTKDIICVFHIVVLTLQNCQHHELVSCPDQIFL